MQVFAVFGMTNPAAVLQRAQQQYPNDCRQVDGNSFLIAAQGITTQDVAASIGLDRERGVVVALSAYFGFHDPGLWEWISLKANGR